MIEGFTGEGFSRCNRTGTEILYVYKYPGGLGADQVVVLSAAEHRELVQAKESARANELHSLRWGHLHAISPSGDVTPDRAEEYYYATSFHWDKFIAAYDAHCAQQPAPIQEPIHKPWCNLMRDLDSSCDGFGVCTCEPAPVQERRTGVKNRRIRFYNYTHSNRRAPGFGLRSTDKVPRNYFLVNRRVGPNRRPGDRRAWESHKYILGKVLRSIVSRRQPGNDRRMKP